MKKLGPLISVLSLLFLGACATTVPLKNKRFDVKSAQKPLVLMQYVYEDPDRETHTFYFTDSAGKDFKVEVRPKVDTETGILFESPTTNPIHLFKFSDGGPEPYRVAELFPTIELEEGKVNHIGFFLFRLKHSNAHFEMLPAEKSKEFLKKAVEAYRIEPSQIKFACTECMIFEKKK
jgi:hypothetical protein